MRVYVAGVYSCNEDGTKADVLGVLRNIGKGQKICADLFRLGFYVFCPWHDESYVMDNFDEELPKDMFYRNSIAWLKVSEAMLVISGVGLGSGVDAEIEIAKKLGIPIFYSMFDLINWRNTEFSEVGKF